MSVDSNTDSNTFVVSYTRAHRSLQESGVFFFCFPELFPRGPGSSKPPTRYHDSIVSSYPKRFFTDGKAAWVTKYMFHEGDNNFTGSVYLVYS